MNNPDRIKMLYSVSFPPKTKALRRKRGSPRMEEEGGDGGGANGGGRGGMESEGEGEEMKKVGLITYSASGAAGG